MAGTRPSEGRHTAATTLRGSSLLLLGRLLSLAINLAVQVLIVRHLSKAGYGSFAYALSIAVFGQTVVVLGLDRGVTRFIPIYEEHGDYGRIAGVLALVAGVLGSLSLILIIGVYALQGVLGGSLIRDDEALHLLLILIFFSPIQAADDLLTNLFAVFARARAIFFRKYLLTPGLRLLVVLLLITADRGPSFLAGGYVAASAIGVAIYGAVFVRTLRKIGLLDQLKASASRVPARELFSFTIPLLTTDLLYAVVGVTDAIVLGYYRGPEAVASLRAVQPAAQLNQLVFYTFLVLFTPMAARLFARRDREGLQDFYWQTTAWIAIVSCPIFFATFSLARPASVLLFGDRYSDSGILLTILSLGYYFQSVLGFNGTTLMIVGKIRFIVVLNVVAVVVNLVANLALIPPYGALGGAIGTAATLVVHNVLKQVGLRLGTGIPFLARRYVGLYGSICVAAITLLLLARVIEANLLLLAAVALASVVVLATNRRLLRLKETFPELLQLPVVRWLFVRRPRVER